MHWLIFLFETTRPVDHALVPEKEFDEGRLEWVPFEDVANKNIPWTDQQIMWPAVDGVRCMGVVSEKALSGRDALAHLPVRDHAARRSRAHARTRSRSWS